MISFILGIAAGLTSSPISVYAAEIAHQKLRGRLIVFTSIAISTGVLLIYFLGFIMQVCYISLMKLTYFILLKCKSTSRMTGVKFHCVLD